MHDPILSVHAECRENVRCIFENQSMLVELNIKNISTEPVGVPVEFLNQKGAHCILIDTETGGEFQLSPPPPPDLSLKNRFTQVAPGESIRIEQLVPSGAIKEFRERMIDLTAKFVIIVPVKLERSEAPVPQTAATTLRILGRDKAELGDK